MCNTFCLWIPTLKTLTMIVLNDKKHITGQCSKAIIFVSVLINYRLSIWSFIEVNLSSADSIIVVKNNLKMLS